MGAFCSWQVQPYRTGLQERGLTKQYPGPPGLGLGAGLTTLSYKNPNVTETLRPRVLRKALRGCVCIRITVNKSDSSLGMVGSMLTLTQSLFVQFTP